jgi:sugar lactone lactonase YvrE
MRLAPLWLLLVLPANVFSQSSVITTYAGSLQPAPGIAALTYSIGLPSAVTVDPAGGFYFASTSVGLPIRRSAVYHVAADGTIQLVAGSMYGVTGSSGDGGPALSALLWNPGSMALDPSGNLYIADTGNARIRKVTPRGIITTVAGAGTPGYSGDGGPATAARIDSGLGIAVDAAGNLYIAEYQNHRVRKVGLDGVIQTITGNGVAGYAGDGGPAAAAQIGFPTAVAVDLIGDIFIADSQNSRIRKISTNGSITTVAGNGTRGRAGDGGPATSAQLLSPSSISVDGAGNLYIADNVFGIVRKVDADGVITTIAGNGLGFAGDGGPATQAKLNVTGSFPFGIAATTSGELLIADIGNHRIRKVANGLINTIAGGSQDSVFSGDGGPATMAQFDLPQSLALDAAGNLYVADTARIRRLAVDGTISTVAGTGVAGYSGDNGPATAAQIAYNTTLTVDGNGDLYVGDYASGRVRKISGGIITTIAGNGTGKYSGDGGPATAAGLSASGLALDSAGSLYIADSYNNRIRKVTNGTITTVAQVFSPGSLAMSASSDLYFAAQGSVWKRSADGSIENLTTVQTLAPSPALTFDASGNLLITDASNRVRKVTSGGDVTVVAGNGLAGDAGDGCLATDARLNGPAGIAVDVTGTIYIADSNNRRIRRVSQGVPTQSCFALLTNMDFVSMSTGSSGTSLSVGYARIQTDAGSTPPTGLAIIGLRQNGVLISETSVAAAQVVARARIFVDIDDGANTGVALVNPNNEPATISFYFTGPNGNLGGGATLIAANAQIAAFLNQPPFNVGSSFVGTFTLTSSVPVGVLALRGFTNERGEFLMSTLPVTDLSAAPSNETIVFPHFADGGGWTTEIALVNPTDAPLIGELRFIDDSGNPATLAIAGQIASTFPYVIPPNGSQKLTTAGLLPSIQTGSVRAVPAANNAAPSGLIVFSFRRNGIHITEGGVLAAKPGSSFRVYAEAAGDFEHGEALSIQTGFAVSNLSGSMAAVSLLLQGQGYATVYIPANGHVAMFLNQVPEYRVMPKPFQGILKIESSAAISVAGLRGRYNERGDFLIATTAPFDDVEPGANPQIIFPHFAEGAGYETQFILVGSWRSTGALTLYSQSGQTLGPVTH